MWLDLETSEQYRFEDITDAPAFYRHLPLLLDPNDRLVLGCYAPRSDIRRFLTDNNIPANERDFVPTDTFDHNRREYPDGAAYHLHAESHILRQLAAFAESIAHPVDLCDHLAAYSRVRPILIYHGILADPLFVSSGVARSKVEAFSNAIGICFEEINFDRTYFPDA